MKRAAWPLPLLLLGTMLLTLAFAPVGQFYLAWVGLIPWLICLYRAQSQKSAFFLSWVGGTLFFTANMWWMANITVPGMLALMIFCGLYWGLAGLVIHGTGLLQRGGIAAVYGIPAVWVAFEFLRGVILTGLPWLFLGHTQTPILAMCQIADVTGVYGVSFWIVAINALIAVMWIHGRRMAKPAMTIAVVLDVLVITLLYGLFRLHETPSMLSPGPTLAVVQLNDPQTPDGEKGMIASERLAFHQDQTLKALAANPGKVDLVVWSETVMPPINAESRALLAPEYSQKYYDALSDLTRSNHVALLTGTEYMSGWGDKTEDGKVYTVARESRNTALLFDAGGRMDDSPGKRYDKVHLVPWGEFIPCRESCPPLYQLFVHLGPKYYEEMQLDAGTMQDLTVFHLPTKTGDFRFVTPICFEDIDARICSAMFRPGADGRKRADFIVNLTNDGWFQANENAQHLQAATFRSIENRAPTARSVNTGISGFIDSTGATHDLLGVRVVGWSVGTIQIDRRLTFYTRNGDLFACFCVAVSAAMAIRAWIVSFSIRRNRPPETV